MVPVTIFVLWSFVVVACGDRIQVILEADRPSLRVELTHTAQLQCCYTVTGGDVGYSWSRRIHTANGITGPQKVVPSDHRVTMEQGQVSASGCQCRYLTLTEVQLNDSGLYQCFLNHSALQDSVFTHGTFLQVYRPMEKTLNISENAKNSILTVEGILLLLCVLLPGIKLLYKAKSLNKVNNKKTKIKEEDNIYEVMQGGCFIASMQGEHNGLRGLKVEECDAAYDQIQRSESPYQDVGLSNVEEEEIQL